MANVISTLFISADGVAEIDPDPGCTDRLRLAGGKWARGLWSHVPHFGP